jgi:hypothetical protein
MRRLLRLLALAVCASAGLCALPEAANAAAPAATCNGGACSGWFRDNITVAWSVDPGWQSINCDGSPITTDGSHTRTCSVTYSPTDTRSTTISVGRDTAPPSASIDVARDPDSKGWYTKPVDIRVSGGDGGSGIAGCSGGGTYAGPDGAEITVSGTCTDNVGFSASASLRIKYDGSPPEVTAAAERPADADGWYNHPVKVTFTGKDGASGIAECTEPVTYAGPDAVPAKVVGQCRDNAGHVGAPFTFELKYDSTKPTKPNVTTGHRGEAIAISWTRGAEVVRSVVVRSPGLKGRKATPLYSGKRNTVIDRKIAPGRRYWYEVRVYDVAGNVAVTNVAVKPGIGILSPVNGSVVRRPPIVKWALVKGARFYNLQLWRGDAKLLTAWPRSTKLSLKRSWTFSGKRQRLVNGKYRLFVWPAFGTAKKPAYGKLVGQVGFVVRR